MPAYHARVAIEAQNNDNGLLIVGVLHMEVDVLASPPNWGNIASDIAGWLGNPYNGILTTHDGITQIVVTDENYPGSTHGQGVAAINTTGGRGLTDTKLDAACCGMLSFKTALAKRYARGHLFLPPMYDSAALSGAGNLAPGSPYSLAAVDFLNALKVGHTAGSTSYVPEIFSRTLVGRGETPFAFPITSFALSPKMHYLRTRLTTP